jgi:hypothetical protein
MSQEPQGRPGHEALVLAQEDLEGARVASPDPEDELADTALFVSVPGTHAGQSSRRGVCIHPGRLIDHVPG